MVALAEKSQIFEQGLCLYCQSNLQVGEKEMYVSWNIRFSLSIKRINGLMTYSIHEKQYDNIY